MEKTKSQLHQLLAVENDRKQKAALIIEEAKTTFSKRADHFDGLQKKYEPFDDNGERLAPEFKEIVTTVKDKLEYIIDPISNGIDAQVSKEETNSSGTARSELIIGEKSLGNLSATSLLALETWITKIREVYKEIPTLDPTKIWIKDIDQGPGYSKSTVETKYRTNKETKPIVLYPATDKHPAQVTPVNVDVQVGAYETIYKSGKITPAQKARILERVDVAIDTIKQARAKANTAEALDIKIGKSIFEFINGSDLN